VPSETEARQYSVSENTRIVFNESGVPQLFRSEAASSNDILRANGNNEILINFSSHTVEAEENTTVINFAGEGGRFVSGLNTTYLGSYSGAEFTNGSGNLTFAGVFSHSALHTGNSSGELSGVFTRSTLNGGDLTDTPDNHETRTYEHHTRAASLNSPIGHNYNLPVHNEYTIRERMSLLTNLAEAGIQQLPGLAEKFTANTSTARTMPSTHLPPKLMLTLQVENNTSAFSYQAHRGYKAYAHSLGAGL
jgi:hypothetical protein